MKFRPCIDLHKGKVKQIVGSTYSDSEPDELKTNFETERSPAEFASMYREDELAGGHVIMLGSGSEGAALEALFAYPGGLAVGGGVSPDNARRFLDGGASHVIVTSYVFEDGRLNAENLRTMTRTVGKDRLVLDLSCRKDGDTYFITTDRWQKQTTVNLSRATLRNLAEYCDEFLVHAAHVEGKKEGIDEELAELLGACSPIPVTYAGGVCTLEDLERIRLLGRGRVDATVGSALDIFGGALPYKDVVDWHKRQQ